MARPPRTPGQRKIPVRLEATDGAVIYAPGSWEAHALQRHVDRLRRAGETYLKLDFGRDIPLERIKRVVIDDDPIGGGP